MVAKTAAEIAERAAAETIATRGSVGPLNVNTEELDVWLSGFFSRLESYALGAGTSEAKKRFVGALHCLVSECLSDNIDYTITTNLNSTGGTTHVCNLSVNDPGICVDIAISAFERGG